MKTSKTQLLSSRFEKNLLMLSVLLLGLGCASTGNVVLKSDPPDTKVYVVDVKSGQAAYIGNTPLSFSKRIPEAKDSDVIQIRLEKDGFESRYASVAAFGSETTFLDLKLSSLIETNQNMRKAFELNRQLLTDANRLASNKRFSEAIGRVEKILESDPRNDEALAAKGSLLYLMKDYEGALAAWKKSLEINPANDSVRAAIIDLNMSLENKKRGPAQSEVK